MAAPAKPINLLPTSDFEVSVWGKFLHWAVTSGRYIIIATEMVVILAFLSRFKLDQDLADINETIRGQQTLLERLKPVEKEFLSVQSRLNSVMTLTGMQLESQDKSKKIIDNLPGEVKLESLIMRRNEVTIGAKTLSEQAIGEMLNRLAREPLWKELEMTNFSTTDGSVINFTLILKS